MYKSNSLDDQLINKKLLNFDINHHYTTRYMSNEKIKWWENEINNKSRCSKCWLRTFQCYCHILNDKTTVYREKLKEQSIINEIVMYYHYFEIGRSANTAHLFEALYEDSCKKLLYGDVINELDIFNRIKVEFVNNEPITCVLYPTSSAITLSEWKESLPENCKNKPLRIIALDGTYPQAYRLFKHIKKCTALLKIPLPTVKLDFGEEGCKSAITGIMVQPQKDKICTFQAVILALRELGLSEDVYQNLRVDLDQWLEYIIQCKVRIGKSSLNLPNGLISNNNFESVGEKAFLSKELSSREYVHNHKFRHKSKIFLKKNLILTKTLKFYVYNKIN